MTMRMKTGHYISPIETYTDTVLQKAPDRLNPALRYERVLAAAIRACAQEGPFDFKMAKIAEVAGASTASIYREFDNATAVLQQATLKAVSVLSNEWASVALHNRDDLTDKAKITAFLLKFGETYRHPFSGWLLRADLAIAANNDEKVTGALLEFQNQIVNIGISCLPAHAFGFASRYDLVQILLGAIQLPIINAILAAPTGSNEEITSLTVDLDHRITSMLAWLGLVGENRYDVSLNKSVSGDTPKLTTPMPKSDMQLQCEAVLSRPTKRSDHQSRREKMLAATMTDCAAVGLEGTSINRIAAIAGVSSASIYKEFEDKNALILASIANSIPIYARATMLAVDEVDPKIRISKMLFAQAITLADPFGVWLFRHYTKLEASNNPVIKHQAQSARARSVTFWNQQLERLVIDGHLVAIDHDLTRDMIFGGIHRRSVLARLLQNDNAQVWSEVEGSVGAATDMLFRLYGAHASRQIRV